MYTDKYYFLILYNIYTYIWILYTKMVTIVEKELKDMQEKVHNHAIKLIPDLQNTS